MSECRIYEYDGAFKCYAHNRMWGAVTNPDEPCAESETVVQPTPETLRALAEWFRDKPVFVTGQYHATTALLRIADALERALAAPVQPSAQQEEDAPQ